MVLFSANGLSQIWHLKFLILLWTVSMWRLSVFWNENLILHMWHSNVLIFSWTVLTWESKLDFLPNNPLQIWHLNFLIFLWTQSSWILRSFWCKNFDGHASHWNNCSLSWTEIMWFIRYFFWGNFDWQMSQLNGLKFSWIFFMWLSASYFVVNDISQIWHLLVSFSWIRSTWFFKVVRVTNVFSQIWHLKFLMFSWIRSTWFFKAFPVTYVISQIWHLKFLIFSWTTLTCRFIFDLQSKDFSHNIHRKGWASLLFTFMISLRDDLSDKRQCNSTLLLIYPSKEKQTNCCRNLWPVDDWNIEALDEVGCRETASKICSWSIWVFNWIALNSTLASRKNQINQLHRRSSKCKDNQRIRKRQSVFFNFLYHQGHQKHNCLQIYNFVSQLHFLINIYYILTQLPNWHKN